MISTDTIEKFAVIVKRAAQARSKEVRIDIADATSLVSEIANVMARLVAHETGVVKNSPPVSANMDGGSF